MQNGHLPLVDAIDDERFTQPKGNWDFNACPSKAGFIGWGVSESWTSCSKT